MTRSLLGRILSYIRRHARAGLDRIEDQPFVVANTARPSDRALLLRTLRYRVAGRGFGLTNNERLLLSFHNRHLGKRCFIIGNGPSLNLCDVSLLKDEVTFGFNSIFLNRNKMGFAPTYYIVEDILVAEDRRHEINRYREPTVRFFGEYLRCFLDDAPNTVWMNVKLRYDEYEGFPNFSVNSARELWVGGTVSYLALQLAFYMGFQDVYLIGFDHHYTVPSDVQQEGVRWTSQSADPNHFHPDYFGKGYRWHDPRLDRMELAFMRARETFARHGRSVRNATEGGRLSVFERVDFNSLFGPA